MAQKMNDAGYALLKTFEGLHDGDKTTPILEPEMDPRGIWTIGWGHALDIDGVMLEGAAQKATALKLWWKMYPKGMTTANADMLLVLDLAEREQAVSKLLKVAVTDNQFSALVDFAYNLGVANLKASTLLKKVNAGDFTGAAKEFPKWVYSGKPPVKLTGLVRRREAEKELFLR